MFALTPYTTTRLRDFQAGLLLLFSHGGSPQEPQLVLHALQLPVRL